MKAKRRLLIAGIIIGSVLASSPLLGLLGTVFGMTRAFGTLGSSGIADPEALAKGIGTSLVSTATGFLLFPVGVAVLTFSLIFFYRVRAATPPPLPGPQSPAAASKAD